MRRFDGSRAAPGVLFATAAGLCVVVAAALLLPAAPARGAWYDATWALRRPIDVEPPPPEVATGDELAVVDFYTAGRHKDAGDDVRVATEDGRIVPSRVLRAGPGDRVKVVFTPLKGVKRYYAYFANPAPAAPPKGTEDVAYRTGLMMDMYRLHGAPTINNFDQIEAVFKAALKEPIGRTMIDRLFVGVSPFGDPVKSIAKVTGTIIIPADGTYAFAAAGERAALFIGGKPVVFAHAMVGDVRFNTKVELAKGRHDLAFYYVNLGGDCRFSVVWQLPGSARWEIVPPGAFGTLARATVGPLEENRKPFTADFKPDYTGEAFFAGNYTHRYRLQAYPPKVGAQAAKYEWDLGDGQTATGPSVDHVYLADGLYPVKLTVRIGPNSDTQTTRIAVSRVYENLAAPPTDTVPVQARIAAFYDWSKVPPAWLVPGVQMMLRAQLWDVAIPIAQRLAAEADAKEAVAAFEALRDATRDLSAHDRTGAALELWDRVGPRSPLQPRAAKHHARLLMWLAADFPRALKVLEPYYKDKPDDETRRLYAQALVLNKRVDEAAKILAALPIHGPADQAAARSGALARTIEFYITDNDWETGEEWWERWQERYPADFLEGYSVVLQSRLLALRQAPVAAARVAEAFALAVPQSSYAPQLLDRASKLLARTDPAKSKALREMLKQKYPEDPLSQDAPPPP